MGILYSIGAAILFAISHIAVRQGVSRLGVQTGTAIMLLAGATTTVLIALLVEGVQALLAATLSGVLFFALAGVFHFLGGWGFQNASASRLGPTRVSAMTSLTPLFAAFLAFISLHQTVNLLVVIGIILMTAGVYAITTGDVS